MRLDELLFGPDQMSAPVWALKLWIAGFTTCLGCAVRTIVIAWKETRSTPEDGDSPVA